MAVVGGVKNILAIHRNIGYDYEKGGDKMPDSNLEIIQKAMDDFVKIQRHMLIAKKENAVEAYASLKKEYLYLKSLLNVAGVPFMKTGFLLFLKN